MLPPPCYVLGLESQIGLALVRELGRAGIPVIGITQNPNAIGLRSRYLTGTLIQKDLKSEAGLRSLRELGNRFGAGVLLAISETNIAWLIDHKHELGNIRPIVPTKEVFAYALNKMQTLDAAAEVGIDIPKSVIPTSWVMVEQIAGNFPFPAVMKWPDPNAVASLLSQHDLAFEKAEHVRNSEEFLVAAKRYQSIGCWPMLQEYCPGVGLGQFFFMHQGRAVRRFQHMRVAEWPPEGGFSSVCDGLPLERFQSLQDNSIKLLQKIGWEGVAMIEYRYDAIRDRAVLMEINGRFWGSYPLAVASGAGFGLYAYNVGTRREIPEISPIKTGLRCRMISTEIKRLFRIIFQPKKITDPCFTRKPINEVLRFIANFLRPNVSYYVWSFDDPKPFFADLANYVFRRQ